MLRSVLVVDTQEILKLSECLPRVRLGPGIGRYVPMFTTGREQLTLVQDGSPILSYRVAASDDHSQEFGLQAINDFMDSFDDNKHLVMLYDDPAQARRVEFRYIKFGLEKSQASCYYLIPDDDVETVESIIEQMRAYGIDTVRHLNDRSLNVLKIADPAKDKDGFVAGCSKLMRSLTGLSRRMPLRVVLHVRYRFSTKEEIEAHAEFEELIQFSFANFRGSMLCDHYIGHNDENQFSSWNKRMLQTHDYVIRITSGRS